MSQLTIVLLALAKFVAGEFDKELDKAYKVLPRAEFIEYFNNMNYTYKIGNYSFVPYIPQENESFSKITIERFQMLPVKLHPPNLNLPLHFDARMAHPQCMTIREIYYQGQNCDSCWAFSVANVASDRICIHKHQNVKLSVQDLECAHPLNMVCQAGYPWDGFMHWKMYGIVTDSCKPFSLETAQQQNFCSLSCWNPDINYHTDKHYAEEVYRLPADSYQIKAELVLNGPIQAGMKVFEDFQNIYGTGYKQGIYQHVSFGTQNGFLHSVRVVGYGVDEITGRDYWIVANTWGPGWGEDGYFRIFAFQPEVGFETAMTAAMPSIL